MDIDFKLLKSEEHFELLCRDLLEAMGARILSDPSRGPDGKKDILIEIKQSSILTRHKSKIIVVQCKHKAISGKSVTELELGDTRSACKRWNANGYLLITSTIPSTTVASNFEAINDEGDYTFEIWDHKLLEHKILEIESSYQLLERYGLYQSLDNVLMFILTVIGSESQFPYTYSQKIEAKDYKGAVYKLKTLEEKDEKMIAFIGMMNDPTEQQIKSIKQNNNIQELYIIKSGDSTSFTISPEEFYYLVNSIKDEWYQNSICKLALCSPANPTLIRIIESLIKNNPYGAQAHSKNLISEILRAQGQGLDFMLVLEAVDTAVKYKWDEFAENIIKWIDSAHITAKNNSDVKHQQSMSAVIQRLASALGRLDCREKKYYKDMKRRFENSSDIQFKADLIEYFKNSKNSDACSILDGFKAKHGDTNIYATNHGVFYNSKLIHFVFNQAPWNVNRAVDAYYSEQKNS